MASFKLHGNDISSVFQLMGYKENDISHSTAWVLGKCGAMLKIFLNAIFDVDHFCPEDVEICVQEYDKNSGITDFEIKNEKDFFIIVEAKRGWILPRDEKTLKRIEKYIETIKILTMPEG